MVEGKRVVAGEAILSAGVSIEKIERSGVDDGERVLEALVREHSRLVYRIAFGVLRHHHEAEDAVQETFLRVLRYGSRLGQIEDPKPWLARIAWRVAVDRAKRQGRKHEIPMDDPEGGVDEVASMATPADETVEGSQFTRLLERLISALPEKLREPLILSTIEEMSPREIARTLQINEAAVRSRVFRARQVLEEKLARRTARK
jgi:RNA polymerase sigma-70 factor, ECF subfamily